MSVIPIMIFVYIFPLSTFFSSLFLFYSCSCFLHFPNHVFLSYLFFYSFHLLTFYIFPFTFFSLYVFFFLPLRLPSPSSHNSNFKGNSGSLPLCSFPFFSLLSPFFYFFYFLSVFLPSPPHFSFCHSKP